MNLKKFLPHSLYGRFLLLIALSVSIVQLVSIYIFYYTYLDVVSKHMARSVIEEMVFVKKSFDKPGYQDFLEDLSENTWLKFSFNKKNHYLTKIGDSAWTRSKSYNYVKPLIDPYNQFKAELSSNGVAPYKIFDRNDLKFIIVEVATKEGNISFRVPKKRIASSRAYIFTLWMILTALITSLVSTIFIKNQVRSILKLSDAAEKFGRGQRIPKLKPSGSREIRSLTNSFIKMKSRITRQITKRTEMLSAVSHDLKTPLTRMKLQLAMMPESQEIDDLKNDISDMEKMVNEYLDFSKSDDREKPSKVRIKKFLSDSAVTYYKKMDKVVSAEINIDPKIEVFIKKIALKRVLMNLIDNAFNYANNVSFQASIKNENLYIIIDDDGPGISKKEKKKVFKPFYRIDNSRNLDKKSYSGGSGLGLSIVMDGVTSHGGNIELLDSPQGGLRVKINIPI